MSNPCQIEIELIEGGSYDPPSYSHDGKNAQILHFVESGGKTRRRRRRRRGGLGG